MIHIFSQQTSAKQSAFQNLHRFKALSGQILARTGLIRLMRT